MNPCQIPSLLLLLATPPPLLAHLLIRIIRVQRLELARLLLRKYYRLFMVHHHHPADLKPNRNRHPSLAVGRHQTMRYHLRTNYLLFPKVLLRNRLDNRCSHYLIPLKGVSLPKTFRARFTSICPLRFVSLVSWSSRQTFVLGYQASRFVTFWSMVACWVSYFWV